MNRCHTWPRFITQFLSKSVQNLRRYSNLKVVPRYTVHIIPRRNLFKGHANLFRMVYYPAEICLTVSDTPPYKPQYFVGKIWRGIRKLGNLFRGYQTPLIPCQMNRNNVQKNSAGYQTPRTFILCV
jgi:hypothetical protein